MAENEDEVMAAGGDADRPKSDEIREDIERTRLELNETVDALGEKLNPRRMAQEGWQAVKSSSAGQGANRLVGFAREHPIPLSIIGVGVTWLVIESRRRSSADWAESEYTGAADYADITGESTGTYTSGTYGGGSYAAGTEPEGSEGYSETRRKITDAAERVQDKASDAAHRAAEMADQARGRVRQLASDAGQKVSRVASNVKNRAVDLGQRTGQQARRARQGYWELAERRPIAAGLATLAAGLLVGLLIPNTQRENQLMGETRDQLLRGAKDASQRTLDKTKEVARSAMEAAGEAAQSEAQRQNLTR